MTLDDARIEIDRIDTQIKPLFLERMQCAEGIAAIKAETGGDVFAPDRERAIIERRTAGVDETFHQEYEAFLVYLMSVSRRHQYGVLTAMQENVLTALLQAAGYSEVPVHNCVEISFVCSKAANRFSLFVDMAALNDVPICNLHVDGQGDRLQVNMTLEGNVQYDGMRRLLCQLGKEAEALRIVSLH